MPILFNVSTQHLPYYKQVIAFTQSKPFHSRTNHKKEVRIEQITESQIGGGLGENPLARISIVSVQMSIETK